MVKLQQAPSVGARYQSGANNSDEHRAPFCLSRGDLTVPSWTMLARRCFPWRAGVMGVALILMATEAHAQVPNNIDYPIPRTGTGVTYAIDFARGNRDAGEATYAGIRIAPPWRKIGVWAGVGVFDAATTNFGAGAGAGVLLLDSEAIPFTLVAEAGAGYSEVAGAAFLRVPIGLTATIRTPAGTGFAPWVKPVVVLQRTQGETDSGVGAAVGFDLVGDTGFGFHVTAELVSINGRLPLVVGAGLQYQVGAGQFFR
ncbi:MAG: hypothetical protein IH876_16265 [Gemmatimonadetes bacterium]|nr:hypothetical protein [Gemmatimonadota bacterium]